jgi:MoaA/NifB/PqqE/SkfB family radical SAM enzyme
MRTSEILHAWGRILSGRAPALSIEITRECPLACPGCYAYNENHLGNGMALRQVRDLRGDALVDGVLALVDQYRPLHLSIVGGDPLVRLFELEKLLPILTKRGVHCQVVTSAFRAIPEAWARNPKIAVVVSIDGLQPEHDARRKPATYDRILRNIAGGRITVHCTITRQMLAMPDYFERFMEFWGSRPEIVRVWMSLYTPQKGEESEERLTPADRRRVVAELRELRLRHPKLEMPESMLDAYLSPPASPAECTFARTTTTLSADLETKIGPCQFGGDPECSECGCVASAGLHAIAKYRLMRGVRVGSVYRASLGVGAAVNLVRLRRQPT